MKQVSKLDYKKYVKALKKAEIERAEEDKPRWRAYIKDIASIQGLSPIQKTETWLWQVMIKGKPIDDDEHWITQFVVNEFADQEALIYFISRGVDCSKYIKNMAVRLKEHKKRSEAFWSFLETRSDNELRFFGLQKKKTRQRKIDKGSSYYEGLSRSHFSLANDDESYQVASMIRTLEWCDIGGYDLVWKEYANRLNEDVNRGGEIENELASQTLFHVCRSDFAIEFMGDNLVKLLDVIEMPDYQLTIPWHRWNHDDMSLLVGIKTNSIFAYAASIAFAEKRLRQHKINKKLVNQAIEWLLESQEVYGTWKISTLLDEPSIIGTCMVVHALAINKPRGWKLAASQACDWLLSKQDDFGFWYESPFPATDPVYLTVLVLDTLSLVKESSELTFGIDKQFAHLEKHDTTKNLSQNFYVEGELIMGDKYKVGDNKGGVQNIGKFKNITSNVIQTNNAELVDKLTILIDAITKSQHLSETEKDEQIEIINTLQKELDKPEPNKTMVKMLGDGLLKVLQVVPDLVKAVAAIAPYLPK
jgi:hypothetical protein